MIMFKLIECKRSKTMTDYQITVRNKYIILPVNMYSKLKKSVFTKKENLCGILTPT